MNILRTITLAIPVIFTWLLMINCSKKNTPVVQETPNPTNRIEKLLQEMTLEEKIGQMTQYNGFWDATGPVPNGGDAKWKYDHLRSGKVGAVLNVSGVENVRKMQEVAVKESRLGIPLLFGLDVIHGHKTVSPIPLAESASWDLEAIKESARMAAIEASARGINWTFAPMVDISRDARWGRVMEGGGEDPYLGSQIGKARVQGFQGADLSAHNTIAATAKHLAGYGFSESGRDYNTVDVGTSTLYNVILPPFKACVDAGVSSVMNSFNTLNGIPATGNHFLQRDLLNGRWDFNGFVVSDWGSIKEMIDHGHAADLEDATIKAANAGSNMDMESYAYVNHLKKAVEEGKVKMEVIDDAVRRILNIKEQLGLFDDPYRYCDAAREKELPNHKDHHATALDIARKSIVLLKNNKNNLPLSTSQKSIAVIGPLASDKNSPLGSWRFGSDDNTAISVLEGLDAQNISYKYEKGAELVTAKTSFLEEVKVNETDKSGFDAAIKLAKESEVVIMVLGEHGFQSGEGRSRTKLDFPGVQQELLEAVHAVNPNIILVVMSGRPLVLTWAEENLPAIVQSWQLGTQSGHAITDVLMGNYNPSGKLPMTFPRSVGQIPIYYNALKTGRPGPIDLVFWSHYIDESNAPLYPFGYGLSYTNFKYSNLKTTHQAVDQANFVKVTVTLKNTGKRAGREVAQLYIRDLVASIARPVKELKGFQLVDLDANESKTIEFTLHKDDLSFYDNEGKLIFEPGKFEFFVGGDSNASLQESLVIE